MKIIWKVISFQKQVLKGFNVKLKEYKLEVPTLAKKTLAETAKISVKLELENKQ